MQFTQIDKCKFTNDQMQMQFTRHKEENGATSCQEEGCHRPLGSCTHLPSPEFVESLDIFDENLLVLALPLKALNPLLILDTPITSASKMLSTYMKAENNNNPCSLFDHIFNNNNNNDIKSTFNTLLDHIFSNNNNTTDMKRIGAMLLWVV